MKVALIGFMGTFKSSAGKLAAEQLDCPFCDTDEMIQQEVGMSISGIFASEGEARFREREAAVVERALTAGGSAVIALGGGAVLTASVRDALAACAFVIWLRASAQEIHARVAKDVARPLAHGADIGRIEAMLEERTPLYKGCANARIATDAKTPGQVARAICGALPKEFFNRL